MTRDSLPPITLPVTSADQLREGSPVAISVRDQPLQRGVVGQLYPPSLVGVWVHGEPRVPGGRTRWGTAEVINQEWLALDLEEKTGRAHAQWGLLAESIRLHKLRYPQLEASVSDWVVLSFQWDRPPRKRLDKWRFRRFTIGRGYIWDSIPTPGRPWEHCPALGGLDPSDRTLLADGSRRVVALALQAVCLQMGGGR